MINIATVNVNRYTVLGKTRFGIYLLHYHTISPQSSASTGCSKKKYENHIKSTAEMKINKTAEMRIALWNKGKATSNSDASLLICSVVTMYHKRYQ